VRQEKKNVIRISSRKGGPLHKEEKEGDSDRTKMEKEEGWTSARGTGRWEGKGKIYLFIRKRGEERGTRARAPACFERA